MKKILNIIVIFVLFCSVIFNVNISYASDINLKSYTERIINKVGKLNESYGGGVVGQADFSREGVFTTFKVRYEWLHAVDELIKLVNSDKVSSKEIANQNSTNDIKDTITALERARDNIGTFEAEDKDVDNGQDLYSAIKLENREGVAARSKTAFKNITGYEATKAGKNEYDNYISKAVRKLNAARDISQGSSVYKTEEGYPVNINDSYITKFKYTYSQIELYRNKVYGNDYNCHNYQIIEKLWNYKTAMNNANDPIAKRKDLYVAITDSDETKKNYSNYQLRIYKVAFGDEAYTQLMTLRANLGKKDTTVKVETKEEIDKLIKAGADYAEEHADDFSEKYSTDEYDSDMIDGMTLKYDKDKNTVFDLPVNGGIAKEGEETSDFINDAESFVTKDGEEEVKEFIQTDKLKEFSQTLYGILFGIGVIVAVIVGLIIGVKLMLSSVEERAEAKKLLVPYIVGCVIVFGAFGIWQLVVTIMQQV